MIQLSTLNCIQIQANDSLYDSYKLQGGKIYVMISTKATQLHISGLVTSMFMK